MYMDGKNPFYLPKASSCTILDLYRVMLLLLPICGDVITPKLGICLTYFDIGFLRFFIDGSDIRNRHENQLLHNESWVISYMLPVYRFLIEWSISLSTTDTAIHAGA